MTATNDTPKRRQTRSIETEQRLLAAARSLFSQTGFHDTGTNDVVAKAGATRGALYHHFADKSILFEAVFRQVAGEFYASANKAAAPLSGDPWKQLIFSVGEYLRLVASNSEFQRIVLIDGPVVLGWQQWRSIQTEYLLEGLVYTFNMLIDRGIIAKQPTEPLASLIMAALDDASLSIAHSRTPEETQQQLTAALLSLIKGLQIRP
ncbi:TetR/AcrR family transcriptional regulator [Zhongshania sp.]|uniref:TetR/AcrR family transcriptional regulator n=1 Tax=Zhongshania sp. TaxID=1971902 RepID=UPI00356B1A58